MRYATCCRSLLPFVAAGLLASAQASTPLHAAPATGRLFVIVKVSDNVVAGTPARASAITLEGRLVDYAEQLLERSPNVRSFTLEGLAEGHYDVRVEGDGLVTEVKRGVPVFAGRDENVAVVVRPGEGLHTVEYAVGCLSREEVAARLASLEAETARLRVELEALASRP